MKLKHVIIPTLALSSLLLNPALSQAAQAPDGYSITQNTACEPIPHGFKCVTKYENSKTGNIVTKTVKVVGSKEDVQLGSKSGTDSGWACSMLSC